MATVILPTLYSLYISALYLSNNEDEIPKTGEEKPTRHDSYVGALCLSLKRYSHQSHKSPASRFAIVFLTLPTGSRQLRLFSLFVNSLLLLASIEFAVEDYFYDAPDVVFTRLGAVYPDRVKLAIRYPHHKDPIHVVWRKVRESPDPQAQPWTFGPPIIVSEGGDWVNSTTISPLWPDTMYECNPLTFSALMVCFLHSIRFVGDRG